MNIKEIASADTGRFSSGHRLCSGCCIPLVVRTVLSATKKPVVVSNATGCLEVASTIYPETAWNVPWIHNTFETAAVTLSGVETAYRALKKRGRVMAVDDIRFVAFGGDGGTYDIGLQALSGTLERGHDMLYVCYDNEAYMNTGAQRSSATPFGAATTTTQVGKVKRGKEQPRKDIMKIVLAHDIPYAAQASVSNITDLHRKAENAFNTRGPTFLNVLSTCMLLWGHKSDMAVELSKLAVETRFWPLYEVTNGEYKLNHKPDKYVPLTEFIKHQARFKHLMKKENEDILKGLQEHVDGEWGRLLKLCKEDWRPKND